MVLKTKDIIQNNARLAYSAAEKEALIAVLLLLQKSEGDLKPLTPNGGSIDDLLFQGVVILKSEDQLQQDFLIIKLQGERGFLGRQKPVYASYAGDRVRDEFTAGTVFRSWSDATTAITNIYRVGGLGGPAVPGDGRQR